MTFARFRNALDAALKASQDRQIVYGLMGVPTDTGHTFASPQAGFVRVRIATKNGPAPTEARNDAGVPLRYDLPIQMKRDANGALYIIGRNNVGGVADAATTEDAANPSGVTVHHHRSVAGTSNAPNPLAHVWEAKQIDRGRVKHAGGMAVNIAEFRYYHNGVYETWEGGDLDLTAYKPATSGHHAWVVVGVDPATNTAVAAAGTSVVYATALTTAGLDAIAFGAYIPCAAVQVRNDDTQLSDITKYYDAHNWFGQGATRFIELADVDQDYTGDGGKAVRVKAAEDGLEYYTPTFLGLSDTPGSYTGKALNLYRVNAGETAVEDATVASVVAPAIHAVVSAEIADGDEISGTNASAMFSLISWTWTTAKAFLKTYFDTLYDAIGAAATVAGDLSTLIGSLGTAAYVDEADYLLLAGRSGGQTAYGGTASGEDLTLSSTAHATKHRVFWGSAQTSAYDEANDRVGVGTPDPESVIHAQSATTTNVKVRSSGLVGAGRAVIQLIRGATGAETGWDLSSNIDLASDNFYLRSLTSGTAVKRFALTTAGWLGLLANADPQGAFHVHDGTGGDLFKSFSSQSFSSRVAVIPNGTGDMLYGCTGYAVVRSSTGVTTKTAINIGPGTTQAIWTDGSGNTLELQGNDTSGTNNGAISVYRTAGSFTYTVALFLIWL